MAIGSMVGSGINRNAMKRQEKAMRKANEELTRRMEASAGQYRERAPLVQDAYQNLGSNIAGLYEPSSAMLGEMTGGLYQPNPSAAAQQTPMQFAQGKAAEEELRRLAEERRAAEGAAARRDALRPARPTSTGGGMSGGRPQGGSGDGKDDFGFGRRRRR